MAVNKVQFGDEVLIDLTNDTVTAETLMEGETAHSANGEAIVGTARASSEIPDTVNDLTVNGTLNVTGNATFASGIQANAGINRRSTSTTTWHDKPGLNWYHYEGANTTTYKLPVSNCDVIAMITGSNRGTAIAINWTKSTRAMYMNSCHDDTGTYTWTGWKTVRLQ